MCLGVFGAFLGVPSDVVHVGSPPQIDLRIAPTSSVMTASACLLMLAGMSFVPALGIQTPTTRFPARLAMAIRLSMAGSFSVSAQIRITRTSASVARFSYSAGLALSQVTSQPAVVIKGALYTCAGIAGTILSAEVGTAVPCESTIARVRRFQTAPTVSGALDVRVSRPT